MPSSSTSPALVQADLQRRLPAIIAGLSTLGPFAIDTYLPSFDSIGTELGATPLQVQQTLTAYILPFAVMALWHGALSDSLGRRRVVLIGLFLFSAASIGAAFSQSIEALWMWRALQGAVGGVGMTVGRAVVRDVADGPIAQRMLSQTTMMFALAPAIAPILGGWLQTLAGWRSVFIFLALISLCLALLCWRMLPETLPPEKRQSMQPGPMARAYRELATSGAFLRLAGALALNFAGFFVYVLAAPAFLTGVMGLGPREFAWMFIPSVSGTMIGAFVSSRLAGRLQPTASVRIGYAIMTAAVIINLTLALTLDPPRMPWTTISLLLYNVGMGLAMAPLQVMLLDQFAHRRGMASSGMSFAQSSGNALVAGLVAPLLWHSAVTMALGSMCALAAGGMLFAWHLKTLRPASPSVKP